MRTITLALFVSVAAAGPVSAQIDLSGNWQTREHEDWQERTPGPEIVDYLGLPLNVDGRARALSYSTSALSIVERQCLYYAPHYIVVGPQGLRIWADLDPNNGAVVAWNISAAIDRGIVKIWMDGRPHPSEDAVHTLAGFATGEWEGNTLTAVTTHMKESYLRRNGVPSSDQTKVTMHLSRHGDTLTILAIIEDPIYLTEPHVISRSWQLDPTVNIAPVPNPCVPEAELPDQKGEGTVPHYLPGKNPFVDEVTKMYGIPLAAVLGGSETMYPEFRKKLKNQYTAPVICTRYCCGWGGGANATAGLKCIADGSGVPGR